MTLPMHSRSRFSPQYTPIGALLAISLLVLPLVLSVGAGFADNRGEAVSPLLSEVATEYDYLGVDGCKLCHRSEAKGNQHGKWQEGPHSKAHETLAGEKAKEHGQDQGISEPQNAEACLVCHVTAFSAPAERKARTYKIEDGVGCESCHGPGSAYKLIPIMQDREKSIANGLLIPDEATCVRCHNDKSPTFKSFNYEEMFEKIAHPNPQKN